MQVKNTSPGNVRVIVIDAITYIWQTWMGCYTTGTKYSAVVICNQHEIGSNVYDIVDLVAVVDECALSSWASITMAYPSAK